MFMDSTFFTPGFLIIHQSGKKIERRIIDIIIMPVTGRKVNTVSHFFIQAGAIKRFMKYICHIIAPFDKKFICSL